MEKEKSRSMTIVVIVLIIIVLGLGGYIAYNEFVKVPDKSGAKEVKKESVILLQDDIDKLMELVSVIPDKESLDIDSLKKFDNQQKLRLAYSITHEEEIKGKHLKDSLIKIFGIDLGLKLESIKCELDSDIDYILYDEKSDTFKYNESHPGHGGGIDGRFFSTNYFVSFEDNGSTIKLAVKKLFDASCVGSDTCLEYASYYTSYSDAINRKNEKDATKNKNYCSENSEDSYDCDPDKIYKGEKDNLETYTYIFEKQNNNFIFKSYSVNK